MAFRILVADDHEVVRRGMCALLQSQPEWQVCGEAADGREAVEKAQKLKPDAVILDIAMPTLNGVEATRQILKSDPHVRVLVLTLHDSDQVVREVLNAGARGFLLKSDAARDLCRPSRLYAEIRRSLRPGSRPWSWRDFLAATTGPFGFSLAQPAHPARARDCAAVGRGKEHERGGSGSRVEREDRRNSPFEHYAQVGVAFGERTCTLRGS